MPSAPQRRWWARPRAAEAVVTALFSTYVAWPFLFGAGYVTGYDTVTYSGPHLSVTFDALSSGRLPQWNDELFGGTVQLANTQTGVFSPLKPLFLWAGPQRAMELLAVTHLVLLAVGVFVLVAWRLRARPPAAAFATVAVVGSGAVMARSIQFEQFAVIAWVPWLLVAVDVVLAACRPRLGPAVAALAATIALLLLAGHPHQMIIAAPLVAAWTVARAADRRAWARLIAVGIAGLLGLGLAAAQILPTLLALDESAIDSRTVAAAADPGLSMWPEQLAGTLLGSVFIDSPDLTANSFEAMGFVGVAVVVVALLGAGAGLAAPGFRWTTATLTLTVTVATVLALGPQCEKLSPERLGACRSGGSLYRNLYDLVPGFNQERAPGRWMLLTVIGLALLAGIGIDRAVRRAVPARSLAVSGGLGTILVATLVVVGDGLPPTATTSTAVAWAVAAAVTVAALTALTAPTTPAAPRPVGAGRALAAGVLVGVVVVELGLPAADSIPRRLLQPDSFADMALPTTDFLRAQDGRVITLVEERSDDLDYLVGGLRPNTNGLFGIRSLDGYDGGILVTDSWGTAVSPIATIPFRPDLPLRWQVRIPLDPVAYARLGVRYALVDANSRPPVERWDGPVASDDLLEVYENPAFRGEALVFHRTAPMDVPTFLEEIEDLAPDTVSVPATEPALTCDRRDRTCDPRPAELDRVDPEELRVATDSSHPGLLVVVEQHQPGWSATVDGRPVATVTVDGMNIGVPLDPGRHEVVLRYRAPGLRTGLVLSGLSMGLVIGAATLPWSRRRLPIRRLSAAADAEDRG